MFNRDAQKEAALELLRLQGRGAEAEALKDATGHEAARVAAGLAPLPMRPQERPAWLDWPRCATCKGSGLEPGHGPSDGYAGCASCPSDYDLDRACPRCPGCGGRGRLEPGAS